jgi:hypothetical protein
MIGLKGRCGMSGLAKLTEVECEIVRKCLCAVVDGPFFEDCEFHTLIGLHRKEVAAILAKWPHVDDTDGDVGLTINNSLANLLGYPHDCGPELEERVGATYEEVGRIFAKWRQFRGDPI